jgi:hypothetical protein
MPNELAEAFQWIETMRKLVDANNLAEIQRLETLLGCTQDEAVNHFVEISSWGFEVPEFHGGRGTPQERRAAMRAAWRAACIKGTADA